MPTFGLSEHLPDAELWQAVCQESVPAFEAVVGRYQSLVCAVAYSCCGDLALSEDVAQEAFWAAWRQRASLAEPGRLGAWLCGIARNLGHNARRRGAPAAPLEAAANVPAGEPGPLETAVSREEEALVWQALEQVPTSYREPLILFYREEQSVAEVAAALGLSADAVKQRLSRGRAMLQERVARLVEGALRRSRPGRPFTAAVLAGLVTASAGARTALAAGGTAPAAVSLLQAAGAGAGLAGGVLGSLGGLLGSWLGVWLPSQLAPTRPESSYLRRHGQRVLLALALFSGLLTGPVWAFVAGRLALPAYLLLLGAWLAALWGYLAVEIVLAARGLRRLRAGAATAEPNDAPLRVGLETLASRYRGRVFRSRLSFLGLPLVDVKVGNPAEAGKPATRRVARGWVAVGDEAYGVLFALGGRACGLVAIGGMAVGLVAVGGVALGGIALGGVAAGGIVGGGLGLGWQACGGLALGWDLACGGAALARHAAEGAAAVAHDYAVGPAALAGHANDGAATAAVSGQPLSAAIRWSMSNAAWLAPLTVAAVVLGCGAALLLMYRREPGR